MTMFSLSIDRNAPPLSGAVTVVGLAPSPVTVVPTPVPQMASLSGRPVSRLTAHFLVHQIDDNGNLMAHAVAALDVVEMGTLRYPAFLQCVAGLARWFGALGRRALVLAIREAGPVFGLAKHVAEREGRALADALLTLRDVKQQARRREGPKPMRPVSLPSTRLTRRLARGVVQTVRTAPKTAATVMVNGAGADGAPPHPGHERYRPVLLSTPTILFRSVSLPELADIVRSGRSVGRQNLFNPFEERREVFFGTMMTSKLIWQGEEIARQLSTALEQHPHHAALACICAAKELLKKDLAAVKSANAERLNRRRQLNGLPPVDESAFDDFMLRDEDGDRLFRVLRKLDQEISELRATHGKLRCSMEAAAKAHIKRLPVTSAVLETRPLTGGWLYSERCGGISAMDNQDEVGFLPGVVEWADIVAVHLVRQRTVTRCIEPKDVEAVLALCRM